MDAQQEAVLKKIAWRVASGSPYCVNCTAFMKKKPSSK